MEFVISYDVIVTTGAKTTDSYGSKGIVVDIWEDEDMPVDKDGSVADVIMDPSSIISRMNAGRLYEQYINGMSRKCRKIVRESVNYKPIENCTDSEVEQAYNYIATEIETPLRSYFRAHRRLNRIARLPICEILVARSRQS